MSEKLEPKSCDVCADELEPGDQVHRGTQAIDATTSGDEAKGSMTGPTAITHARCWPPAGEGWRRDYVGPLSGIRPYVV